MSGKAKNVFFQKIIIRKELLRNKKRGLKGPRLQVCSFIF